MPVVRSVPGLYREDRFVRAKVALPTGVPIFLGFGQMSAGLEIVERVDQFVQRWRPPQVGGSFLGASVTGFFGNGGVRCFVAAIGDGGAGGAAALASLDDLIRVLDSARAPLASSTSNPARARELDRLGRELDALSEADLVLVPDAFVFFDPARPVSTTDFDPSATHLEAVLLQRALGVQAAMLSHCQKVGGRFAILDAPPRVSDPRAVLVKWSNEVSRGLRPEDGALYFPWVRPLGAAADRPVPPSGHVAGIIARSDTQVGVFKAPANEEIQGVVDLYHGVGAAGQAQLNPAGINCLRELPGRGLRVYGAVTLSTEPEWRYVNVRRLFSTVERWIARNMTWATFEPNSERLWVRIRRELGVYLEGLWRAGGLQGATAAEAFFVKCDAETNPAESRDTGQVVTELGLAASLPAEFIVVRITQRAGTTQVN